jgi:hypothetical protein
VFCISRLSWLLAGTYWIPPFVKLGLSRKYQNIKRYKAKRYNSHYKKIIIPSLWGTEWTSHSNHLIGRDE